MLHVFIGEILANMTQVSDVAPGPLVLILFPIQVNTLQIQTQLLEFSCIQRASVHMQNCPYLCTGSKMCSIFLEQIRFFSERVNKISRVGTKI
jgi:hypothetical protein